MKKNSKKASPIQPVPPVFPPERTRRERLRPQPQPQPPKPTPPPRPSKQAMALIEKYANLRVAELTHIRKIIRDARTRELLAAKMHGFSEVLWFLKKSKAAQIREVARKGRSK